MGIWRPLSARSSSVDDGLAGFRMNSNCTHPVKEKRFDLAINSPGSLSRRHDVQATRLHLLNFALAVRHDYRVNSNQEFLPKARVLAGQTAKTAGRRRFKLEHVRFIAT